MNQDNSHNERIVTQDIAEGLAELRLQKAVNSATAAAE